MSHLLTLLFEVTELFEMRTRPELILLQKTMVVVEGVARSFDPKFNMWVAAEPVVAEYILKELGPAAKLRDARDGFAALLRIARHLPDFAGGLDILAKRLPDLIESAGDINEALITHLAKDTRASVRSGQIARWVTALALVAIAAALLF